MYIEQLNQCKILSEAYFGKNDNLVEVEKAFKIILDIYKNENAGTKYIPILQMPSYAKIKKEITRIENIIKKEFGFKNVIFSISTGTIGVNASVYHNYLITELSHRPTIVDTNGIKYEKETTSMICHIADSIFLGDYTAGEITAIILHEIGHKFYYVNNIYYVPMKLLTVLTSPLLNTIIKETIALPSVNVIEYINKRLRSNNFMQFLDTISANINNVMKPISLLAWVDVLLKVLHGKSKLTINSVSINPAEFYSSVRGEKFADNFAISYGYGIEVNSALAKLGLNKGNYQDQIPIIRTINDMTFTAFHFIRSFIDPHPGSYQRMSDNIKYIKEQASNEKDMRIKNEIMRQANSMEKALNRYRYTLIMDSHNKVKPVKFSLDFIFTFIFKDKINLHTLINKPKNKDWEQFR